MPRQPYFSEGVYYCEIAEQALGEAGTGTVQIIFKIKVLGKLDGKGDYEEARQQYQRTIFMPVTERTIEWVQRDLRAAGYTGHELSPLDPEHEQHVSLVGTRLDCYCAHGSDQKGDPKEVWRISSPPAPLKAKKTTTAQMSKLDALFGRTAAGSLPPNLRTAANLSARTGNSNPPEITDDDIPF